MPLLILFALTGLCMLIAAEASKRFWQRRHGEIRPSILWLIFGVGIFAFTAPLVWVSSSLGLTLLMSALGLSGLGMIGFYFHRRILFRRRGLYDVRAGRVRNAVPYACAWQCQLGDNLEKEGIIIQGVGARRWPIPGATSKTALSEALWCLQEAGVRLPQAEALQQRFGITPDMVAAAARKRSDISLPNH